VPCPCQLAKPLFEVPHIGAIVGQPAPVEHVLDPLKENVTRPKVRSPDVERILEQRGSTQKCEVFDS
jgi:hypothetical protein